MAQDKALAEFQSLYGSNAVFVEELYEQFKQNPSSVDASWREIFSQFTGGTRSNYKNRIIGLPDPDAAPKPAANKNEPKTASDSAAADSIRALQLIRAYRENGHYSANLDPLGLAPRNFAQDLDPATYGFTEADYDNDELDRFPSGAGFPGKSSADWGWVQHIHASLNEQGRAAVVLSLHRLPQGKGHRAG